MNKDKEYSALLNKQIAEIGKEVRSLEFNPTFTFYSRFSC